MSESSIIGIEPRTFFTVLIPLRNCEPWVGECLDSLLAQQFPSWNAIVCDDASDDGSWAVIDAKVGRDPRFRFVRNRERRTALPNLMDMVRMATGDHILILDGDDALLRHDALDIIFAVYNDSPDVIATSGQYIRWPDGGLGHCRPSQPPGVSWFEGWQYGHTLTFRRDVCVEQMDRYPQAYIDIDTGKPFASTYDLALFYPIVAWAEWHGKRVAHINIPTYLYRRWRGNDDADTQGRHLQLLCDRKIKLIWMNLCYRHDFEEGLVSTTEMQQPQQEEA